MTRQDITLIGAGDTPTDAAFKARHLINGRWQDSGSGAVFERHSPAHGTLVSVTCKGGKAETLAAIAAARCAFDDRRWSGLSGK